MRTAADQAQKVTQASEPRKTTGHASSFTSVYGDSLRPNITSVTDEPVVKGASGGTDTLLKSSVSEILRINTAPSNPGVSNYNKGTDYIFSPPKSIDWSPAGGEPSTGVTYYVSYTHHGPTNSKGLFILGISKLDKTDTLE